MKAVLRADMIEDSSTQDAASLYSVPASDLCNPSLWIPDGNRTVRYGRLKLTSAYGTDNVGELGNQRSQLVFREYHRRGGFQDYSPAVLDPNATVL